MSYELDIEAILEDDLSQELPLMRVLVADLDGPRQDINKIFKLTSVNQMPIGSLKHLRRVRSNEDGKVECILCEISVEDDNIDEETLISDVRDSLEQGCVSLKNYRIIEVPSRVARTETQLEASSKIWPTKFAKSEYLMKCMEGSIVNTQERLVLRLIINNLVEYLGDDSCLSSSGAVIFRYAKVYGVGLSCCTTIRENPTKHSTMIAIDSVARNAGAGHWPPEIHSNGKTLLNKLQQILNDRPELAEHKMDANFLPYICTNYDIVITEEPCMMCATALLHSRIRRLFYLDQALDDDQQTSLRPICFRDRAIERFLIHRDKNINHRFEAWRIKLVSVG